MTPHEPYPSAPSAQPKLPGKVGIWIGSILMVLGMVGGGVLVVMGIVQLANIGDSLQRVPVPEGGSITISEDDLGTQTVFAETVATSSGTSFSTNSTRFGPVIDVNIAGPNGEPVALRTNTSSTSTYTFDGRSGVQIGEFEAPEAGSYEIRPLLTDGSGPYRSIAVGSNVGLSGLFSVLGGAFGGGGIFVIGLIILIISLVRRSSAKRAARSAQGPWGGGPWGGGPWAGGPGDGSTLPPVVPAHPGYGGSPGTYPPPQPPSSYPPPSGSTPGWQPPPPATPPPLPPSQDLPPASPQGPVGPSS